MAEDKQKARLRNQKWRAENAEHYRNYQREYKRRYRAQKKAQDDQKPA